MSQTKIKKLSDYQIKQIPKYVDKWVKIGLETKTVNIKECRKTCYELYEKILKRKKVPVVVLRSPLEAWIGTCLMSQSQIRAQFWNQVVAQVGDQVKDQIRDQVRDQVWDQVEDQVWVQVGAQVRDQVKAQVVAQVVAQVGDQIRAQVEDQVEDQVGAQVESQIENFTWPYLSGNFDSFLFSFYSFFKNELKIKKYTNLYDLWEATSNMGIIYPLDNICIVSDRAEKYSIKNHRLHCDGGPAIKYRDNFCVWALNGVRVPQYLAETSEAELDIEFFKKEKNVEIKAQFIRKYGIERMRSIGKSINIQGTYELIDMSSIFSNSNYAPYLKMLNPSTGTIHMEGVSPQCSTVQEALNWRNQNNEEPFILT